VIDHVAAINIGLSSFADPPRAHGAEVVSVDWRPPVGGDPATALLLARLADDPLDPIGARVEAANAEAVERILSARPTLVDLLPAREAIPDLGARTILHAGPPIAWERMCGPMRGAIAGAIVLEGWAADLPAAEALAASGAVDLEPAHHHGAVGPMAGALSPSMPVWVVRNEAHGNVACSNLNEGLGRALRYGANGPDVLDRLAWMRDELGPTIRATLRALGPTDLKALIGQALQMGDECHNRNVASTSLLARRLAPAMVRSAPPGAAAASLAFLEENNHFFLNLSMAACKATMDAAAGIEGSTVVTAIARNGVEVGVRVSGTGDRWFTAPATVPDALYFPGYGPDAANPDIGDSAITETAGIGGFAMAAAPAITRFVGGAAGDALRYSSEMGLITLARNPAHALPALDFAGSPTAIDARKVVETGIAPLINTGVAHRLAGVGQIGAGIVRAPLNCFLQAVTALAADLAPPPCHPERSEGSVPVAETDPSVGGAPSG
jgi:hypothetical protein